MHLYAAYAGQAYSLYIDSLRYNGLSKVLLRLGWGIWSPFNTWFLGPTMSSHKIYDTIRGDALMFSELDQSSYFAA